MTPRVPRGLPATRVLRAVRALRGTVPVWVVVGAAVAAGAVQLLAVGADPVVGYREIVLGAVGDRYHLGETVVRAVPVAVVALGVVPALRARVFTIGSEGQLAMGALASTVAVLALGTLPAPLLLAVGALAGVAGGALWALPAALLRGYARVNEILSTLLLNYVAGFGLLWLLRTALREPGTLTTPSSADLPEAGRIPTLLPGTRLHWGVVLVLVAAAGLAWWVRSPRGFALDVYGTHPALAARMGVRPAGAVVSTMLVGGAAAGLAGWVQVAGVQGRLYPSVAGGLGFTGLVVALLGGLRPAGVLGVALIFGALATGAEGLQVGTGVPASLATVVQALLLGGVALSAAASHRRLRRGAGERPG
ncbi:MAG TPA: ABC transporter permease [Micromonosporaceae bacterium]|nr:ABC transporter permease [Micromonosporaceae bacterium]